MRAVLAVAVVLAMTGGAVAGDPCAPENRPPLTARAKPIDPYTVTYVSHATVQRWCGRGTNNPLKNILGCVPAVPDKKGVFHILIDSDMPANHQACVLTYEFSHLPPNNWVDVAAESRGIGVSVEAWSSSVQRALSVGR